MSLKPAAKPGIPVRCQVCDHEFPQDPPYAVACPACNAAPRQYCRRPSGHSGPFTHFHRERDLEALRLGAYDHVGQDGKPCGRQSSELAQSQGEQGAQSEV